MASGDVAAGDALLEVLYGELHSQASVQMRRQAPDHTLQPTALVNEAWLKLICQDDPQWTDRRHFLQVGAKAMRSVLVDHVRAQRRHKRDGGVRQPLFEDALSADGQQPLDVIALDDALQQLAEIDPGMAAIVELRFFGGRTMPESAECLGVSLSSAERSWRMARAWLFRALGDTDGHPDTSSSGESTP